MGFKIRANSFDILKEHVNSSVVTAGLKNVRMAINVTVIWPKWWYELVNSGIGKYIWWISWSGRCTESEIMKSKIRRQINYKWNFNQSPSWWPSCNSLTIPIDHNPNKLSKSIRFNEEEKSTERTTSEQLAETSRGLKIGRT